MGDLITRGSPLLWASAWTTVGVWSSPLTEDPLKASTRGPGLMECVVLPAI